jgi:ATP-binding cassette, subfamily B, bacterial
MSNFQDKEVEIPSTPFAFIWFIVKPYKKWLFVAIFLTFLQQLFHDLQSYAYRGFIDAANTYMDGATSLQTVFWWIFAVPVLLLLGVASIRGSQVMMNYLTVHARTGAIKKLFEYLSLHSLSYFNDRFSGALSSRVGTISGNVSRLTWQFVNSILGVFFSLIVTSILIYSASRVLAFAFVAGFIVLIPINLFLTRKQIKLSEKMAETMAKLQGQVIDSVTNISAVQQYARRGYEIDRLDTAVTEHRDADVKSDNFRERVLLINNLLVWVFIAAIIYWSFTFWSRGEVSTGQLIMITTLTLGFMRALTHIGQNLNNIMEFYGEVRNGIKEIVVPIGITDKPGAQRLDVSAGVVSFEDISFAYENDQRRVFDNLFFNVRGGEKVGVVGTSGAGKTTLMKLILRQHDLLGGSIKIDGQDIRDVTQESLRENISVVPQEPMLFHRSIRENILYGKLDATEEEMIEVAKKAQAHDFIELLPQKYDSLVGERGVKLSVGQRQRITIARAFLKNAPILILDEATSALDSESEVAVQKALQALMEGKTVFAIAHRLSTLREMDRILVFKDGEIVEDGSHRALIRNKVGVYASFWNHQAGGFIWEI